MCLSIFDLPAASVDHERPGLEKLLMEHTHFGMGAQSEMVEVLASFQPRIVRMADPKEKPED